MMLIMLFIHTHNNKRLTTLGLEKVPCAGLVSCKIGQGLCISWPNGIKGA